MPLSVFFLILSMSISHNSKLRMPTWFIPHGGGPCFFMDWNPPNEWKRMEHYLRNAASRLPQRPKAILMVSAHWLEPVLSVTSSAQPALIYDYYGFPPHTYSLQYPAPGDPPLAARVVDLLGQAQLPARMDAQRGFDHGMFIPLMLIFPAADIPVVQLSLGQSLDPELHLHMGAALAPLRDEGVLIIGSGMSFHNLRTRGDPQYGPMSEQFDQWLTAAVESDPASRRQALLHWEQAPFARQCHPPRAEEHLLPLMVAAGAAGQDQGQRVYSDWAMERAMSGFSFGA